MNKNIVHLSEIENLIVEVRGQQVIIDSDVAALYGVETRDINKAVKNNPDKFPDEYIITLNGAEKNELVEIFHRFNRLKHSTATPKAFTERGLYMLATILKGGRAVQTTIAIIDTFAKLRQLTRTINQMAATSDSEQHTQLMQKSGDIVADILGEDLHTTDTETELELNLAVLKLKHTIKRRKD